MRTLTRITRREAKKIYKKDPNLITIGCFTKANGGAYWGHLDGESFEQFYQRMRDYLPHRRLVYGVYSGEDTYKTGLTQLVGFDPKPNPRHGLSAYRIKNRMVNTYTQTQLTTEK